MTVNVYVDGFNFYNRIYRSKDWGTHTQRLKWVDLRKLGQTLANPNPVGAVYLFTAKVFAGDNDPSMPQRQQRWWEALKDSGVEIVEGTFKQRRQRLKLARSSREYVQLIRFEEKATDVNLASYLLRDGFTKSCQEAIVISNDSDLENAIKIAVNEAGIRVRVVSPDRVVNASLKNAVANALRDTELLGLPLLRASQFPSPYQKRNGQHIDKPKGW